VTTPQVPEPTPGFEFPISAEARDVIDQKLRQGILNRGQERPVLESVRPERRKPVIPELSAETQVQAPKVSPPVMADPRVQEQARQVVQEAKAAVDDGRKPFLIDNPAAPVTPVSTAEYTSIDLPSKFAYYPFKDLYIKPFRVPHLAKLAKANDVDSMQLVCEVVSSVLMTPSGHQNIAFRLSVNDFNAVLYWLRANSFEKQTMRVQHMCSNPAHHEKVKKGLLPRSSLDNESSHDVSKLETRYLDTIPDPEVYHIMITLDDGELRRVDLRPETMMDSIEFLDDPRLADEDFQYVARIASMLDLDTPFPITPEKEGDLNRWTLQDKIEVVEEYLTNDQALLVLKFSELVDDFGVVETVNVKCKECGHEEQSKLIIDARTFPSPHY